MGRLRQGKNRADISIVEDVFVMFGGVNVCLIGSE